MEAAGRFWQRPSDVWKIPRMHDRWGGIPGFAAMPSPAERKTGRVLRHVARAAPGVDAHNSKGKSRRN